MAIWKSLLPGEVDEGQTIDVVCNIIQMNQHECIVTHALGKLSDEVNVAIGLKCIDLGYRIMHFAIAHGHKASRHAMFQKTAQGLDWYTVDLLAEASKL